MPGIFGGIGCDTDCLTSLQREHESIGGRIEWEPVGGGIIGGRAHPPGRSTHLAPDGTRFAVDGDKALHGSACGLASRAREELFAVSAGSARLSPACAGNVAGVDPSGDRWLIATEPLGTYPLYYSRLAGGLLFSSLLSPLAR